MRIDELEEKIKNYNGNSLINGILLNGKELILKVNAKGLGDEELMDFSSGMIYNLKNFKSLKNFSDHFVYSETKNHDAREVGKFLEGGQNIRR